MKYLERSRKVKKVFSVLFALVLMLSFSLMTAVPAAAQEGSIELVATGDSTATWTTEQAQFGSYSAKLTMPAGTGWANDNAEVQISISGAPMMKDITWSFWTLTLTEYESYAAPVEFYADVDGDGVADKIDAGNILKSSVPITDEWYQMTPELWKGYGGGFYVWREDGTGFDFFVGADPWAKVVERWGDATLLRVDLGFGPLGSNEAVTTYVDDFTINGIVYELEPSTTVGLAAETVQITAISVTPSSINFGSITPGQSVLGNDITVENIGTVTVIIDAWLDPPTGTVFNYLKLNGAYPSDSGIWDDLISSLLPSESEIITTELDVPSTYSAQGSETARLIFEATAK